jgi:hypothetical protein
MMKMKQKNLLIMVWNGKKLMKSRRRRRRRRRYI